MIDPVVSQTSSQRHFLPADRPLLGSVSKYLLGLGDELKDCMVIVPTAHSGRQLRQALPTQAGRAVLAPSVVTPDVLTQPKNSSEVASKIELWSAWSETLRRASKESLSALFPQLDDIDRDFNWGLKAASRFCKLKEEISSVDCSFQKIGSPDFSEEPERWIQLANIDEEVTELLGQRSLKCPSEAKRTAVSDWSAPKGVRRIVIACVPDLPMLARIALSQSSVPIDILVHADPALADYFSPWGVPAQDFWTQCQLPLPASAEETLLIHHSGHAASQALIEDCATLPSDQIALAVTDSAFAPMVRDNFERAGWPPFNPEGRSVSKSGLWAFLRQFRLALVNPHNFQPIPAIIKSPEVRTLLPSMKFPADVAREIDKLIQNHLPQNLSHAILCASPALKEPLEDLQALLVSSKDSQASRFIERLFDKLERSADFPTELIDPFIQSIDALRQLEQNKQTFTAHHALDLVMAACEGTKIQSERTGTVIDQLGWLELPYSDEPHLRILGFHENCVPERPHDDGFLPESLRDKIQLYSRLQLESRDSFLLHSLLTARPNSATTRIYLCQTTPTGEERQASRLLMRCPESQLPARVQHCFNENVESKDQLPAYSSGNWQLLLDNPPVWPSDKELSISPSKLKNFLHCPFRFYLKQIEGFNRQNSESQELNPAQFGNLVHDVLEAFGLDPEARDLTDEEAIMQSFSTLLETIFVKRYGKATNLPLSIQKESALRRLEAFAAQQAAMRAEGWRIKHVELAIGSREGEIAWSIFDTPVSMRIDRIDVHEASGQWRVIDYKTSKKVKTPTDEHFENIRPSDEAHHLYGEPLPPASTRARSERRWQNLQLPLYAAFVKEHFSLSDLPEVAYVAFPAATSDTGLQLWAEYDDELHYSALEWTENAIKAMRTGNFPIRDIPAKDKSWDDFAALHPMALDQAFSF